MSPTQARFHRPWAPQTSLDRQGRSGYPLKVGPQPTPAGLQDVHGFSPDSSLMSLKYSYTLCWRHVTLTCWLPLKHWWTWHNRETLFHIEASSHSIQVNRAICTIKITSCVSLIANQFYWLPFGHAWLWIAGGLCLCMGVLQPYFGEATTS